MVKKITFSVDRGDRRDLVTQVADGFRDAIVSGTYGIGERLPSQVSIARKLGASLRVVNEALARLADEGLVISRPRTGCVVTGSSTAVWRGRILLVLPEIVWSYYFSVLSTVVSRRMMAERYLFSTVAVGGDFALPLENALTSSVDMAVMMSPWSSVASRLHAAGVPYLVMGFEQPGFAGCRGWIPFSRITAIPDFAMHCRRRRIRSVLMAGFGYWGGMESAEQTLRREGMEVEMLDTSPAEGSVDHLDSVTVPAFKAFSRRFGAVPRPSLPDVIFFTDDFVACGGLTALLSLGIKVPKDVKVVTLSNRHFAPAFPVTLTRMEYDPFLHGERIADHVIACINGRRPPDNAILGPEYIIGESFA